MNSNDRSLRVEIELNPREIRFYDRLRAIVIEKEYAVGSGIRDLLMLLPDLTVLLFRLVKDSRVPVGAKVIAGFGVAYILSPIDLMPEFLFGPIGLIDDLFVVVTVLSRLMKSVHPDIVREHWSGQGDALDAITRVTTWADMQITKRLPAAVRGLF
ncbi:MAG: YkvA family protein [bacterium]